MMNLISGQLLIVQSLELFKSQETPDIIMIWIIILVYLSKRSFFLSFS